MGQLFTELFPEDLAFEKASRIQKAKKMVAILKDAKGNLSSLKCLDYGSSVGIITSYLGKYCKTVVGVDVDKLAIKKAQSLNRRKNVSFKLSKEKKIPFADNTFDIVIFSQVYEHVEDPKAVVAEVYRVLKKGGVCFFGARNKYFPMDGHYNLPFISILPKMIADLYVRTNHKKSEYDIKLLSYWQLKELTSDFDSTDYTLEVIKNPEKYKASDVVPANLWANKILIFTSKIFYSLIPNYIWILKKQN